MTLVEILASIVILGIVIIAVSSLTGTSLVATMSNDKQHKAQLEAEQYLGKVKNYLDIQFPTTAAPPTEEQLRSRLQTAYPESNSKGFTLRTPVIAPLGGVTPDFAQYAALNKVSLETFATVTAGTGQQLYVIYLLVTWS